MIIRNLSSSHIANSLRQKKGSPNLRLIKIRREILHVRDIHLEPAHIIHSYLNGNSYHIRFYFAIKFYHFLRVRQDLSRLTRSTSALKCVIILKVSLVWGHERRKLIEMRKKCAHNESREMALSLI